MIMIKRFRERFIPRCGPYTLARFFKHTEDYVRGFGREAELRTNDVILDLKSYRLSLGRVQ